jgi:hypothetical protein
MKKFAIVFTIITVILLGGRLLCAVRAQDSAKDDAPTFYRLVPGTYVNGWPRFTIRYPKDWVEVRRLPLEVFRAAAPGTTGPIRVPAFAVTPFSSPLPLDKYAESPMSYARTMYKDATLISDKPVQLRDGTPAREVEIKWFGNDGMPRTWLVLGAKKGDVYAQVSAVNQGKIGEDLKAILYSLTFEPGKDELVMVPPDVQAFLDNWRHDLVSHDLVKVMAHYSDRFLESGMRKGEVERSYKQILGPITSVDLGITDFVSAGDKAYLTGFISAYSGKTPLGGTCIIKENGEWKFYGNQRNVAQ